MSDHDFDYIEREIKRIERDIKLARGYSARDHLNTIPSAVEAAASVQRCRSGARSQEAIFCRKGG